MYEIDNYYQRSYSLLASQFQIALPDGSLTNFQKLLYSISSQSQLLQTQLNLLYTMRDLQSAQGVQLDGIGQILGLPRSPGQSDDNYRQDLYFQIFVNHAFGTPEQVIFALKYLTKATDIFYLEIYPAAYILTTNGLSFPSDPGSLVPAIQSITPAGVNFIGVTATYDTVPFVFCEDPIFSVLLVAPDPNNYLFTQYLLVDPGSGPVNLLVQAGETVNPNFGGGFAEYSSSYFSISYTSAKNVVYSPIIVFNILQNLDVFDEYPDAQVVPGSALKPIILSIGAETLTDNTGSGTFLISPGSFFSSATINYLTGNITINVIQHFNVAAVTVVFLDYFTVDIDAAGAGRLTEQIQM